MTNPPTTSEYGPWAMVTGASSGIGAAFADALAADGLKLILVARRKDLLQALAKRLQKNHSIEVLIIEQDLSAIDAAASLTAAIGDRDLGLLVSNAGFGLKGPFEQHAQETLSNMFNVNARTPLLLIHTLLPRLKARAKSGIILTGSMEGEAAFPWSSAYAATKAFIHSLGMGIWEECRGSGVDVLVLAPGSTDTEAPIKQGISRDQLIAVVQPAEVARQALMQLGRKPFHLVGFGNRVFIGLLRMLPKSLSARLSAWGLATALRNSGRPIDQ